MSDEFPPRPALLPLTPPERGYEGVAHRARVRKARRATSLAGGLVVVAIVGALAGMSGHNRDDVTVADTPNTADQEGTTTTTRPATSTTAPAIAPLSTSTTVAPPSPGLAEAPPPTTTVPEADCCVLRLPEEQPMHRGRVVDEAGRPLEGIWVYSDVGGVLIMGFPLAVTDGDGSFAVECSQDTLTFWGRGPQPASSPMSADRNWAPRRVGARDGGESFPCTLASEPPTIVTMSPGVVFTGIVRDASGNPVDLDEPTSLSYGLPGFNSSISIYSTDASGRYWLYGMVPGNVPISNNGSGLQWVEAVAGSTVLVDWGVDPTPDPNWPDAIVPIIPGTPPD